VPDIRVDVLIVGAGAAGCAAALSLPQGIRAIIAERRRNAAGRCCGGLLAPDAQRALVRLELTIPEAATVLPSPRTVNVHDVDAGLHQNYRRNYVNVDRARFDAWLLELARERADFLPGAAVTEVARGDDAVTATVRRRTNVIKVRAGIVIGADGAASSIRRLAFPLARRPRTAVAMQTRIPGEAALNAYEVFFARRWTNFYAWAIPKPGEVLIGSAFDDPASAGGRFDEVIRCVKERLALAGDPLERRSRLLTRPRRTSDFHAGDERILLAGETAGLISASSGEGISYALESGAAAGRAVASTEPASEYRRAFAGIRRRAAWKLPKARVIFSPPLRRFAMRIPWCP